MPGLSASVSTAPLSVDSMRLTSPTGTPLSLTSEPGCIALPTLPVVSWISVRGENALLYISTAMTRPVTMMPMKTTPNTRSRGRVLRTTTGPLIRRS